MTDHEEIWAAFVAGVDVEAALNERPGGRLDRIARDAHKQRVLEHKLRPPSMHSRLSMAEAMDEASAWMKRRREAKQRIDTHAERRRSA